MEKSHAIIFDHTDFVVDKRKQYIDFASFITHQSGANVAIQCQAVVFFAATIDSTIGRHGRLKSFADPFGELIIQRRTDRNR